ncbi:hypothetical protein GL325_14155 [Aeromicrobium sp. 636]|uniref:MmcQ/YjbR family DNA-binding protein n=1 Tax=Aeromicrobium senzhongii TaxID=2663859 RepID=A0A8I0K1W9_9ACTN|nr:MULTISPECIES: MmcQ/YjbR family DNA-binding protein [Aeromicrobium]MBC9227468.1 MmcQ/YjbR family DNA-binding protein [Aeromicrobium senzhongii]MCQ3999565.1 hypothetical protein [Aeromicrobium sp. 636]
MDAATTWTDIEAFLLGFPDTEASTSWGMPGVKTGGRLVAWWRDRDDSPGCVAVKVDRDEAEALIQDAATPFHTNDHLRDRSPNVVLFRPGEIDPVELRELLTDAWRVTATPSVLAAWTAENEPDA